MIRVGTKKSLVSQRYTIICFMECTCLVISSFLSSGEQSSLTGDDNKTRRLLMVATIQVCNLVLFDCCLQMLITNSIIYGTDC